MKNHLKKQRKHVKKNMVVNIINQQMSLEITYPQYLKIITVSQK